MWILIFVLGMSRAGGPATAPFATELACEKAGQAIQKKWPHYYEGHICILRDER